MKKFNIFSFILVGAFLTLFTSSKIEANTKAAPEVGIVEHLGQQIPMDLTFTDAAGNQKKLKDIITKPTVLALVYYRCPGICSPLLTGMGKVLDEIQLEPGKYFQALTISFDHREGSDLAKKWQKNYMSAMKRNMPKDSWLFMTGDSISIKKLADAVGFYFKQDDKGDYIHAASIYVLTPDGKISRYLFGTEFLPFDLKMSLVEAAQGKSMPAIAKVVQYCFSYDPSGNKYVFNVTKVAGTLLFGGVGIFFLVLVIKGRSKKGRKKLNKQEGDN